MKNSRSHKVDPQNYVRKPAGVTDSLTPKPVWFTLVNHVARPSDSDGTRTHQRGRCLGRRCTERCALTHLTNTPQEKSAARALIHHPAPPCSHTASLNSRACRACQRKARSRLLLTLDRPSWAAGSVSRPSSSMSRPMDVATSRAFRWCTRPRRTACGCGLRKRQAG